MPRTAGRSCTKLTAAPLVPLCSASWNRILYRTLQTHCHSHARRKRAADMRDTIWITNDGRQIPSSHMEMEQILRCIKRIQRDYPWRAEYLERLELELIIRKITRRT